MTTSTQTQLRRGTTSQINAMTPAEGEPVYNKTTKTVHMGDGSTAGGNPLAQAASPAFTGTPTVPTASVGTNTDQAASTKFVNDSIAAIPPADTYPAAVTAVLNTGSSVELAVDFTTYSAYDIIVEKLTASAAASSYGVDMSQNAGGAYTGPTLSGCKLNGNAVTSGISSMGLIANGRTCQLIGTISQLSAGGTVVLQFQTGDENNLMHLGNARYAMTGAVNKIRFALNGGAFSTGNITLQPKAKR